MANTLESIKMFNRRDFCKGCLTAAAGVGLSWSKAMAMAFHKSFNSEDQPSMPMRRLGRTGLQVSAIGFGGIVIMNQQPEHAAKVVADSIAKGVNYFDVAPTYGDAEVKLGPALKPFRKDVFLACKTTQRDRRAAAEELKQSLEHLQTDYFDVYQLHALNDVEKDVKAALGKSGAIQTFLDARKNGIIRNIGFSAHSPQAALAAMKEFDFDTIMYPVNFYSHFHDDFDSEVLAEARKQNMGIISIKAIAKQKWQSEADHKRHPKCWYEPIDDPQLARLALSWSLDQGVSLTLPPAEQELFELCLSLVPDCKSLTKAELAQLKELAAESTPLFPKFKA